MKNKFNKKAESLVWIIVWVFILSFVLLWIWNLIWTSRNTISEFNTKTEIDILSKNAAKILNNLDLKVVDEWDVFYIYKDTTNKIFKIFIWEHNNQYKYINKYWEKIDNPVTYDKWNIYTRIFQTKTINVNWEKKVAVKSLIKKIIK